MGPLAALAAARQVQLLRQCRLDSYSTATWGDVPAPSGCARVADMASPATSSSLARHGRWAEHLGHPDDRDSDCGGLCAGGVRGGDSRGWQGTARST